jgi:hypothetical protein
MDHYHFLVTVMMKAKVMVMAMKMVMKQVVCLQQ